MNVAAWFKSWLAARFAAVPSYAPIDHAARLSIRRFEDRQVLSVGAILVGMDVTFTGDDGGASADDVIFSVDSNGLLEHNLGGTNGFNSSIDLDNLLLGDQTLAVGSITSLTVALGDDADSVHFVGNLNFAAGGLSITAESITEAGSLTVQGSTTLEAGNTQDIILSGANDFNSIRIVSANHTTLNDTTGLEFVGDSAIHGHLTVTAGGAITDGTTSLTVDGLADLAGTALTLGGAGTSTHFGSLTFQSPGAVTIQEDSATALAGVNTALSLDLDSAGAITDGTTSLTVNGLADLAGTALTLGGAGTSTHFGSLTFQSPGAVTIQEDSGLIIGGSSSAGGLSLDSTESASLNAIIDVIGDTMVTAGATIEVNANLTSSDVMLLNAGQDLSVASTISAHTVTLEANDDILIEAPVVATDLISSSAGQDGSGSVLLKVNGSLSADNFGNTAEITINAGNVSGLVTLAGASTADKTVTVTAADAINGAGLVTANAIDLNAGTGIGNITTIQLSGSTVAADTTTGNIDIHNVMAATFTTITTGTGTVHVKNTGDATFATVTTTDGAIDLEVVGDLTVGANVEADGGDDDLSLKTTTSGSVILTGTATAVGNRVLIESQGTISGAGLVTGENIDLKAETGIAAALSGAEISAAATNGNIDLDNASAAIVTLMSVTTGAGDVMIVNASALALQGTVHGQLTATATTGDLTDSGTLIVAGTSSFTSTGEVLLDEVANDFVGSVSVAGLAVKLVDSNSLLLGQVTATSLEIMTGGLITIGTGAGEDVTVTDRVTLTTTSGGVTEAAGSVISTDQLLLLGVGPYCLNQSNTVATLAANVDGTISYVDADSLTVGTVASTSGLTTSDDDVKLGTGGNLAIGTVGDGGVSDILLGSGDLTLLVTGTVTQLSGNIIAAAGLQLVGDGGAVQLDDANDITTLAANRAGTISFRDINSLVVGTVTDEAKAPSTTTSGILTAGFDVKLVAGDDLLIDHRVDLGTTGLFTLDATGTITQSAGATLTAAGLALTGSDATTGVDLGEANALGKFASNYQGSVFLNTIGDLTVSQLTDTAMTASPTVMGISSTTNGFDVTLVTGGNLAIQESVNLGTAGRLFVDVTGNVTQTSSGTITAAGLALKVDGHTALELANDVDTLAANTQGTVFLKDVDDLTIGTVAENASPASNSINGITTGGHDVTLVVGDAAGEHLSLKQAVNLGTGDLFLDVAGDVTQVATGTIHSAGLALKVDGSTTLELANDVETLAADTHATVFFNDTDQLSLGTVTENSSPSAMSITGVTTSDSDVMLSVGDTLGESLLIEQAVDLGNGVLFLDVAGSVSQTNPGTINAAGLALAVDGNATLGLNNDVDTLAADTNDTVLFHDTDDLTIGIVTENASPSNLSISGITTSNDAVSVTTSTGDLTLVQTVHAGAGDVSLEASAGSILDGNDGHTLITARDLSLTAHTNIGDITDFAAGSGNSLDVELSGQLTRASVSAAGGEIFLDFQGHLSATMGSVNVGGANAASAILRNSGGDIDVGSAVGVFSLSSGDKLALESTRVGLSGGTLQLPDAGLNVGTGDLRLRGDFDVLDATGRVLGPLVADDLHFTSGASGGQTTLETSIKTLSAQITGSGAALTVNEADGLTLLDVDTTNGNITVNASQSAAGDIIVIDVNAGSTRVTLANTTNGGGEIIDGDAADDATLADITANEVDLSAGTGISNVAKLEVAAESFAATTATGDINVRDVTGDLAIVTLAGGTSGVGITAGTAGDNICVTSVGTLAVHAGVSNVGVGDRSILLASDGATNDNDLSIHANVSTTGGNASITLLAGDTVSFAGTTTTGASGTGEVRVHAGRVFHNGSLESAGTIGGDIVMMDGAVIQSDDGNITLTAPDGIQLSIIHANTAGTTGDIILAADADHSGVGAITESLTGEGANLIADRATLRAATGIGSAGSSADLDTTIGTLDATNTTSGSIFVQETDTLVIGGSGVQTLQGNGSISIDVDDGGLTVDRIVTAYGAGIVTLNADLGTVDLNAEVRSSTGAIAITGDIVTQDGNIATGGPGAVDVTADQGSITMEDGATTTSDTGHITYSAPETVAISVLQSSVGSLNITADSDTNGSGALTDNTAGEASNLITRGSGILSAAMGIGSADDIDTTLGTLIATNTTSGHFSIQETSGLVIDGTGVRSLGGSGSVLIDVDAGGLTVNSPVAAQGDGTVTLVVDAGHASLNAAISSTTGDISITADSVNQNHGANISTGTALLETGTVSIMSDNGAIVMADGTKTTTETGEITYIATQDVALSLLISTSGDLNVTAGNGASVVGAISDNTANEAAHLVTSGRVTLTAETGIGSGGGISDIETTASAIRVTNSTSGNIDLTESDAITILQLSQQGGGNASVRTSHGTITVDNADAAPNAITIDNGGALLLDAPGASSDIVVNDGIQAMAGNLTLLADRHIVATSAPIVSTAGNGNIVLNAGQDISILDPSNLNPVDLSVAGSGSVSLIATNTVVLGSQNPNAVSNLAQHTVANDVLVQTGTGSLTNTLPLIFDIKAPQVTALGEAVLTVTVGRPGESNLSIRIFWGDGTVQTFSGLPPGTYTYSHFYTGNPNPLNPAAPILINVQAAHDPHVVLAAQNVNTPVKSVINGGVDVPPPVPVQNINDDLSRAVYNSVDATFAALQPNVLTRPGDEADPGLVIFQDAAVRATTVPVPGEGLASFVFDTTPPVVALTFPEAPKIIDTQPLSGVQLSGGSSLQIATGEADDLLSSERMVILEIVSPDGTVRQRVVLPETTLDDMHEVIGRLPDGEYRFLLKEPGEDRLRLLLEFGVRQGKIADESETSDRPPTSTKNQLEIKDVAPAAPPVDTGEADKGADSDGSIMQVLPPHESPTEGLTEWPTEAVAQGDVERESPLFGEGWSSMSARRAWKHAEQFVIPESGPSMAESHVTSDSVERPAPSHAHNESALTGTSAMFVGAMTALVGVPSWPTMARKSASPRVAHLGRGAQLLRKFASAMKSG